MKERSGEIVIRTGVGVPGIKWEVRAVRGGGELVGEKEGRESRGEAYH